MKLEDNNPAKVEKISPDSNDLSKETTDSKNRIAPAAPEPTQEVEPEKLRKLFVGGLYPSTTDESLREFYSQFGEITDVIVMRDPVTKRSRGFGFVCFARKSMVDAAMAVRPHFIDGKNIDAKRAIPRDEKNPSEANMSSSRLYIGGIREGHTEEMFREYFQRFGNVINSEIIRDKSTGKPRGFAFITFDDYDAVDQCVLQKNHTINNQNFDVKKGLRKDEMPKIQHQRDRNDRMGRSRGMQRTNDRARIYNEWAPPYGGNFRSNDAGYNYGDSAFGYAYNQAPPNYNGGGFGYGSYGGGYGEAQTPSQPPWQGQPAADWPPATGGWGQGIQPQPWTSQENIGGNSSGAQQWANAQGVNAEPGKTYYY